MKEATNLTGPLIVCFELNLNDFTTESAKAQSVVHPVGMDVVDQDFR